MSEAALTVIAPKVFEILFNRNDFSTLQAFSITSKRIFQLYTNDFKLPEHLRILKSIHDLIYRCMTTHAYLEDRQWMRSLELNQTRCSPIVFFYKDIHLELRCDVSWLDQWTHIIKFGLKLRLMNPHQMLSMMEFAEIAHLLAVHSNSMLPSSQHVFWNKKEFVVYPRYTLSSYAKSYQHQPLKQECYFMELEPSSSDTYRRIPQDLFTMLSKYNC